MSLLNYGKCLLMTLYKEIYLLLFFLFIVIHYSSLMNMWRKLYAALILVFLWDLQLKQISILLSSSRQRGCMHE